VTDNGRVDIAGWCPTCGSEYQPGYERCVECGTVLVPKPPAVSFQPIVAAAQVRDLSAKARMWSGASGSSLRIGALGWRRPVHSAAALVIAAAGSLAAGSLETVASFAPVRFQNLPREAPVSTPGFSWHLKLQLLAQVATPLPAVLTLGAAAVLVVLWARRETSTGLRRLGYAVMGLSVIITGAGLYAAADPPGSGGRSLQQAPSVAGHASSALRSLTAVALALAAGIICERALAKSQAT
jgi:hypothetical protein